VKPAPFEYHLPTTVEEAVDLLGEFGDDAKVLAGGQSLIPLLALRLSRADHLIDVNQLEELSRIRVTDGLSLGAITRHRVAETSPDVRSTAPLIPDALAHVGHLAIRTRGTVGGSVTHADPAGELPATLLALDGAVVARSRRGERIVPASDLFTGFLTTSLEPDELVTEITIPAWPNGAGHSVHEFARRSGDFAIAGALALVVPSGDGRVREARISLMGVASTPVRARTAEQALVGEAPSTELWAEAAELAAADLDPPSDLHGSAPYRRQVARTMVRRALADASSRTAVTA
jgi:aerobic carbon-monoxide dehydrogenase medium subunit